VKLDNTFTVPVAVDTAWQVLLDVERIAPCMPGATLTGNDGDPVTGNVKVKVATITSRDDTNHVAVIEASGKETRGSGTAKAVITARLHEQDGSTEVAVETDLTITGKPAQFGRGVMAEISGKLITQFADCLAAEITADSTAATVAPADTVSTTSNAAVSGNAEPDSAESSTAPSTVKAAKPAPAPTASPEAIDLLGTAGLPILKRVGPIAVVAAAIIALLVWRHQR
jgi:carbon monoxide dehydrogenase subunit G